MNAIKNLKVAAAAVNATAVAVAATRKKNYLFKLQIDLTKV